MSAAVCLRCRVAIEKNPEQEVGRKIQCHRFCGVINCENWYRYQVSYLRAGPTPSQGGKLQSTARARSENYTRHVWGPFDSVISHTWYPVEGRDCNGDRQTCALTGACTLTASSSSTLGHALRLVSGAAELSPTCYTRSTVAHTIPQFYCTVRTV